MNTDLIDIKIRAVEGGVTAAAGFKAAGIHAGFRKNPERLDYALVVPDKPCPGAGVFTTNRFCAAPVQVSRVNLGGADKGYGIIAGVSINSGNANAATGETGLACARETCNIASQVIGCEPQQILVASTGVIGQILPIDTFEAAVPSAYEALSAHGGADAAHLRNAPGNQSGLGIVAVAQAVGDACRQRDDIFQGTAQLDAEHVRACVYTKDLIHKEVLDVLCCLTVVGARHYRRR